MGVVATISLLILVFAYGPYQGAMLAAVDQLTATPRNLAVFVVVLIALPATLLFSSVGGD